MAEREREKTGGWAQFDWLLDGGSFKAQPIEFWLLCFNRKLTNVSAQIYLSFVRYCVNKNISIKKLTRHK
jgi:hypothetical protein